MSTAPDSSDPRPRFVRGQRVRIRVGPLGMVPQSKATPDAPDQFALAGEIAEVRLTEGTLPDGWLGLTLDRCPGYWIPVDPCMVEEV